MVVKKNLSLVWFQIYKLNDVKPLYIMNAAALKLIKISKNFHGRFTAKHAQFLSSHLIPGNM